MSSRDHTKRRDPAEHNRHSRASHANVPELILAARKPRTNSPSLVYRVMMPSVPARRRPEFADSSGRAPPPPSPTFNLQASTRARKQTRDPGKNVPSGPNSPTRHLARMRRSKTAPPSRLSPFSPRSTARRAGNFFPSPRRPTSTRKTPREQGACWTSFR